MKSVALLISLAALAPLCSWAAKADRQRPLVIQGGDGSSLVSQTAERAELLGPVTVTQGSLLLRASRLLATKQPDDSNRLLAGGSAELPVRFSQNLERAGETVEAQADELDYDERSGVARFMGNARVRKLAGGQLQSELSGALIVFNTLTEELRTEGPAAGKPNPNANPNGGGPRIIIMPKSPASEPAPSPALPLQTSPALKPQ